MPEIDIQHEVALAMEQFKRYCTQKSTTNSQPQQQSDLYTKLLWEESSLQKFIMLVTNILLV